MLQQNVLARLTGLSRTVIYLKVRVIRQCQ